MKPSERQLIIIDQLHQQGTVSVSELVESFGISAETIRRDLSALARQGKLQKTHGGAAIPRIIGEGSLQQRLSKNVAEKRRVAQLAAQRIAPGDSLFIDTGSTTVSFAEEISRIDDLTIITNSCDIARITGANKTTRVFLLGGSYNADNHQTIGPLAIAELKNFSARLAVLTIGGIHADTGITDFNIEEALVAQAMIAQAQQVLVLADSSKLDVSATFNVCQLADIDHFISAVTPQPPLQQALHLNKVEITEASMAGRTIASADNNK